ncbi:MAG: PVC-type heme-binding CxxCH protein [Isosphaeraceae bacterium]
MQKPLEPAESMKHGALPEGFRLDLFAAEPQIYKPICMNWDHKGRLWIAETIDYPNEMQRKGEGRDRIVILEDTDGDHKADKFTVFADKLSIPTSMTFARGGLVVSQAPDMLFLKDTDGDDKADLRETLFTGWGTNDTHAGPSNLRYGLDNWIYGIVGYAGFRGTVGGEDHRFSQGFFRFKPDGSKLEFLRNTNNNSWGTGFSEEGLLFGSTANGCPSVFMPIPNRYYEKIRGGSSTVLGNIADSYRMFPITENVRQVDWFGGFTAGAGHALYTARTYPSNYWNKTAFVAEPTGHLLATFTLHPRGTAYGSHNSWNLFASDDEWSSPIAGEVGPDGHVWMIDWYNYIIQHNPTPQGFQTGKGAAYETPLRDKTHGRIYRIVYEKGKESPNPKLDPNDPASLLRGLKSENQFWRMHAQRLLVERGKADDVVNPLIALVNDRSVDEAGLNAPAIHALWTLQGLGQLGRDSGNNEAILAASGAAKHASAGVRRNAILAVGDDGISQARQSLNDADPQVRLAALLAIGGVAPAGGLNRTGYDLVNFLQAGKADGDKNLADAATIAAASGADYFPARALAGRRGDRRRDQSTLITVTRVAEHYARSAPDGWIGGNILSTLANANPKLAGRPSPAAWPRAGKDRPAAAPRHRRAPEDRARTRPSPRQGRRDQPGDPPGEQGIPRRPPPGHPKATPATARDDQAADPARVEAAGQAIEIAGRRLHRRRLAQAHHAAIVARAGRGDAQVDLPERGQGSRRRDRGGPPEFHPQRPHRGGQGPDRRADWTGSLLKGIEGGQVSLTQLAARPEAGPGQSSRQGPRRDRQGKLLASSGGGLPDPDRQKVIEEIGPKVLTGGDPVKGKLVYTNQCAKCRIHGGQGGKVGPDLTGMAAHPREELLIHILDPSRSVEELRRLQRRHDRRPGAQRPARLRDQDRDRAARRRGQDDRDPPRRDRGSSAQGSR